MQKKILIKLKEKIKIRNKKNKKKKLPTIEKNREVPRTYYLPRQVFKNVTFSYQERRLKSACNIHMSKSASKLMLNIEIDVKYQDTTFNINVEEYILQFPKINIHISYGFLKIEYTGNIDIQNCF